MSRSIRDNLKRSTAQAVNHTAQAVLDVDAIYKEFKEAGKPEAKDLENIMIALAGVREALILFAGVAWDLTEDKLINWQ